MHVPSGALPGTSPLLPCLSLQEEIVDETDNEPINARVLTMSLSQGIA
jgi:hypothetical protein